MLAGRIPEDIASLLYAALAADTGGFRYANTTPFTHKIAAKLMFSLSAAAGFLISA